MQIDISKKEMRIIISALYAVAPSGGGSGPFALAMKLANEYGVDLTSEEFQKLVQTHCDSVVKDWKEATGN